MPIQYRFTVSSPAALGFPGDVVPVVRTSNTGGVRGVWPYRRAGSVLPLLVKVDALDIASVVKRLDV